MFGVYFRLLRTSAATAAIAIMATAAPAMMYSSVCAGAPGGVGGCEGETVGVGVAVTGGVVGGGVGVTAPGVGAAGPTVT